MTHPTTETTTEARRVTWTRRARFRDLFAAEWIKFWSLRSTVIVLAAVTGLYLAITYRSSQGSYGIYTSLPARMRGEFDPSAPFRGPDWFLMMVIAGSVGALTIVGEHASGLIRTTFTAVPDRTRVAAAKLAVVTVVMTGVGAVVTAGGFAINAAVLHSHHIAFSPSDPGAMSLIVSTTLIVPLCAVVGMGLGALIRNTAAAVIAVCALFILVPVIFKGDGSRWSNDISNALPCFAWSRLTTMGTDHIVGGLSSYTGAWVAFAAWPLVSAVIAVLVLRRRDV